MVSACMGMRTIAAKIRTGLIEVGLDATCKFIFISSLLLFTYLQREPNNTNSRDLELCSIIDNEGYPLPYCLLSTTGDRIREVNQGVFVMDLSGEGNAQHSPNLRPC